MANGHQFHTEHCHFESNRFSVVNEEKSVAKQRQTNVIEKLNRYCTLRDDNNVIVPVNHKSIFLLFIPQ